MWQSKSNVSCSWPTAIVTFVNGVLIGKTGSFKALTSDTMKKNAYSMSLMLKVDAYGLFYYIELVTGSFQCWYGVVDDR